MEADSPERFLVIPAIDLKDGRCVRLFQGEMARDTVYSDDPGAVAVRWQGLGAERLHVVDLNGAFAGRRVNSAAIRAILAALAIPVQLGGGIRTLDDVASTLEMGIRRVILGTVACRDPDLVREACRLFPGRVSVGIDARDGLVAVSGWAERTDIRAVDLARRFEDAGVAEIIFTDIHRDGALTGPNIAATRALAESITIPVIVSGGVSGPQDIVAAREQAGPLANGNRLSGIITGKAIYDGRLDFAVALRLARGEH
ncbi:MAG: 1-(5-phosphoribosyl)-5-[(5-phosphoribosylamino)methylideneamino]imidazole-4-carboxamide isomerase [Magnetococcales bacterium]|nr:1-(5-phosphoribosyl)-5-[(5-phosphoribosylamino)methylideneamino]imidazole-4-carboxamide isomerase [Magnetococcales bacterium]MBF0156858.1 1-(5-phosphoribosyl)-5-[(5-phosphoribosylamino)methylideneamino]imidazole-4-carboxamide isomerase [Magnetococcales bacterium]